MKYFFSNRVINRWNSLEQDTVDAPSLNCFKNRTALGRAHLPPTDVFQRLAVNKTIFKNHGSLQLRAPNSYTLDFPDVIKFRIAAHTILETAIRFRHPDYNRYRAEKLISSSMSRHLLTRNISSKSMHAYLSNLAIQTDKTDKRGQTHLPPPLSEVNKNLAIANISRVSCAHNTSRAFVIL